MSTPLTVNGITFQYPTANDQSWGQQATLWATAITAAVLPKAGGTFNLTGEIDFGTQYGFKLKSVRLSNGDVVAWRNAAGSADLPLTVNSSNKLTFNGAEVFNGAGYLYNLQYAAPQAAGSTPGSFATVNPNGKLNMTLLDNQVVYANNLNSGNTVGQVRWGFKATASGALSDQYSAYAIFDANPVFYGTGSVHIPNGTTAQRSAATSTHSTARDPDTNTLVTDVGSLRYNTDYKCLEVNDGRRWAQAGVDQLRTAPQFFDEFYDSPTTWVTGVNATTTMQEGSFATARGVVGLAVSSGGATGTATLAKALDVDPAMMDYVEWRVVPVTGASCAVGTALSSNVSGPGFSFTATFSGGNATAHGTGNWIARAQDDNQTLTVDTGVAVQTSPNFQTLRIEKVDAKTVKYYIDGNLVATITFTSNITRGAVSWRPTMWVQQLNVSGTYYGTMFADYCAVKFVNIRN